MNNLDEIMIGLAALMLVAAALVVHRADASALSTRTDDTSHATVLLSANGETINGFTILRPMIAPEVGVTVEAGAPIAKYDVLRCAPGTRERTFSLDGVSHTVTELTLDCGPTKLVVKGIVWQ